MESELRDLFSLINLAQSNHQAPQPRPIIIANATWDPKNGTAKVYLAHDMVFYEADGVTPTPTSQIPTFGPYPVFFGSIGIQGPPVGGERGYILPVLGGNIILITQYDDGPGFQPGEWGAVWPQQPKLSFFSLTNDGNSTQSAANTAIVTAPQVCLGENRPQGGGNDGVVREVDLQQAIDDLTDAFQSALNQLAQMCAPGSGVPPPTIEQVEAQSSQISFSA